MADVFPEGGIPETPPIGYAAIIIDDDDDEVPDSPVYSANDAEDEPNMCAVCLSSPATGMANKCHHVCVCFACSYALEQRKFNQCVLCRATVDWFTFPPDVYVDMDAMMEEEAVRLKSFLV